MQNLIHNLHALLFNVLNRLSISKSQNVSSELLFLDRSPCFGQIFKPIWILEASIVFSSKHATVMGPTPPGTGVIYPATLLTLSNSTSPRSFPLTLVNPMSTTAELGFTWSARTWKISFPTALIRISAVRVIPERLGVLEWQTVTVASLLRRRLARGLPTRLLRLMITALDPAIGTL